MNSFILSTFFVLFTDPTGGGRCEEEERVIATLEAEVVEYEDMTATLDRLFLDFYLASDPSGGASGVDCSAKDPGLDTDICECIADPKGMTISNCIADRQGGPIGGL